MNIKNLKIGYRLGAGFAVILTLIVAISVISLFKLSTINDSADELTGHLLNKEKLAQTWSSGVRANSIRALSMVKTTDTQLSAYLEPEIAKTTKEVNEIQKKLEDSASSDEEKALFATVASNRASYIEKRKEILKLKEANDNATAQKLIEEAMVPALNKYLASIQDVLNYYDKQIDVFSATVDDQYASAQYTLISMSVLSIVLASIIGWLLTRGITKPVNFAVQLVNSVAKGDLRQSEVTYKSKDEIGQLVHTLFEMKGELHNTISQIRQNSDNVAVSTNQIAVGNMDLSGRTESQAGVLEETASTMEELTATVKQNTENVNEANKLAVSASEVAVAGGQIVKEVITTMKDIKESSHKIVDIISVIDSIAFQTNILALNAAVEAARAGEQGRGFAVVASEVRNLAQKSAVAAKEIKQLITSSVEKIDEGNTLVDKSGTNMENIVNSINNVMTIMNEISLASSEQTIGITQINQAIGEIDSVTQQNASLVEQAAAAAASLEEQAKQLAEIVSTFTLEN